MQQALNHLKFKVFVVTAIFLLPFTAFTQSEREKKIDSILSSLQGKDLEEKRDSYLKINSLITRNGGNEAEQLFEYAVNKDGTEFGKLVMYEDLAKILSRKGNTDEALRIREIGLALAEKLNDKRYIIQCLEKGLIVDLICTIRERRCQLDQYHG